MYRVVHDATGRPAPVVQAEVDSAVLVDQLGHPNVHVRETAQRLLAQRDGEGVVGQLEQIVLDESKPHKNRMHALWALIGARQLDAGFVQRLLESNHASLRAWGVRSVGEFLSADETLARRVPAMAADPSPDVQLQVAIAAGKLPSIDPIPVWIDVLVHCGEDRLIPHIVWQNMHPYLPRRAEDVLGLAEKADLARAPGLAAVLPHVAEKLQ